ncbi:MAG: hypothetical protein IJL63_06245 [Clostridia bacterium]|nr:hypothetical protein [Clostridia bacterium]
METNQVNNDSQSAQNKGGIYGLIKFAILFAVIYAVISIISHLGNGGASGKNIKVRNVDDYSVYFSAVCPSCKHVHVPHAVALSKGESCQDYIVCDNCGKIFQITVKR